MLEVDLWPLYECSHKCCVQTPTLTSTTAHTYIFSPQSQKRNQSTEKMSTVPNHRRAESTADLTIALEAAPSDNRPHLFEPRRAASLGYGKEFMLLGGEDVDFSLFASAFSWLWGLWKLLIVHARAPIFMSSQRRKMLCVRDLVPSL